MMNEEELGKKTIALTDDLFSLYKKHLKFMNVIEFGYSLITFAIKMLFDCGLSIKDCKKLIKQAVETCFR